ncbi:MAG: toxin [Nitrospirae bacterium]|nr:toxin [Nitrospirota bacterium]
MVVRWDQGKNERLKRARGVSFEEILGAKLLAVEQHASRTNQKVMLFELRGHVWVVPFVRDERGIFLKTLFPSRKLTKRWRKGGSE